MPSPQFDPQPPERTTAPAGQSGTADPASYNMAVEAGAEKEGPGLLALIRQAESISQEYHSQTLDYQVTRSYRAWRNRHSEQSKYLKSGWKGRSRLFVPKTRAAVRKNMATAASALFATEDVTVIEPQFDDDPIQGATAAVIHEDLNMRLTRATGPKSGIPWFMICMGANLDAQITGVSVSKQYWDYQEVDTKMTEIQVVVEVDEDTGQEFEYEIEVPVKKVIRDRPMSEGIPIENIMIDPAAPWFDPIQLGSWLSVRHPMHLGDARAMMKSKDKDGNSAWLEVSDEVLLKGRNADERRSAIRRSRESEDDRFESGMNGAGDLDIIWINENFIRVDGRDLHFWSVGSHAFLSKVQDVEDSYPEQGGGRPYTFGVAAIDTHRVFPMSPVESWQPLQLEMNDIVNLRLDSLKRQIAPLTKVLRGKNVDQRSLQNRGRPDAVLMVHNHDDVMFEQPPGPSGQAYQESNATAAVFDDLSGSFSGSSVANNRELNETVGGMKLLSGSANAISEFDLRVWVETWVEPTLRQIVHLIKYYESDEHLLAIAGQKAEAVKKFDYIPGLDDFERVDVLFRVNVGVGAADPMQKLGKLKAAIEMLLPILEPLFAQGVEFNGEALIEEVMGAAGYRDGRRFFKFKSDEEEEQPEQPPPEMIEMMEKLKIEKEKLAAQREKTQVDNQTKVQLEKMKGESSLTEKLLELRASRDSEARSEVERGRDRITQILAGRNQQHSAASQAPSKPTGQQVVPAGNQMPPAAALGNALNGILDRIEDLTDQVEIIAGQVARIGGQTPQPPAAPPYS